MKKHLLIILTLLPFIAASQNYQLIFPNYDNLFTDSSRSIQLIHLDSIKVNNGDSVFYNYRMIDRDSLSEFENLPANSCINLKDTSWLGIKVIKKADGKYLFFDRKMDTISFYPDAEDSATWKFMSLDSGNYIEAQVSASTKESFLGVSDSIKEITLQAKNVRGQNIVHKLNKRKIKWSKSYGFITIPDFYYLPDSILIYNLAGINSIPSSARLLNVKDIYNYNIGDEFQNFTYRRGLNNSQSTYTKKFILDKTIYADSIVYKDSLHIVYIGTNTVYVKDTIEPEVIRFKDFTTDTLPFQTDFYEYDSSRYNGRTIMNYISPVNSDTSGNCMVKKVIHGSTETSEQTYAAGLGEVIYYSFEGMGIPFSLHSDTLKYYKKGSEVWGTLVNDCDVLAGAGFIYNVNDTLQVTYPYGGYKGKAFKWYCNGILLSDTTNTIIAVQNGWYKVTYSRFGCTSAFSDSVEITNSITGINNSSGSSFNVYPNPAKEIVTITSIQEGNYTLRIFNIIGVEIGNALLTQKETTIDISNLTSGLFYLNFTNSQQNYTAKLIVQR